MQMNFCRSNESLETSRYHGSTCNLSALPCSRLAHVFISSRAKQPMALLLTVILCLVMAIGQG